MRWSRAVTQVAVEAVDDEVVGVHGDRRGRPGCHGDAREVPVVGADVEDHAGVADGSDGGGDEGRLGVEVAVAVVAALAVLRPRRLLLLPGELLDGPLQVAELCVDQRRAEPGALQLGTNVSLAVGVGVLALGAGVQADVREDTLVQVVRCRR